MMACIVVFITTYVMILPAITMENGKLTGDNALISRIGMKEDLNTESREAIYTGTAPFDGDNEPGNDQSAINNVIRTFDSVTYTIDYYTGLQEGNDVPGYESGMKIAKMAVVRK